MNLKIFKIPYKLLMFTFIRNIFSYLSNKPTTVTTNKGSGIQIDKKIANEIEQFNAIDDIIRLYEADNYQIEYFFKSKYYNF